MKNNKKYLLPLLLILFLSFAGLTFAVEVNLGFGDNPTIGQYVSYLFTAFIGLGITGAVISFAIGALQLASPSIESHNDGKSRMISAIVGVLVLTLSVVIINTINPDLKNLDFDALPSTYGVYLVNDLGKGPCPTDVDDVSQLQNNPRSIEYVCKNNSTDPKILVLKFPKAGLESGNPDLSSVTVSTLSCGGSVNISGGSFRWTPETPGVYFYVDSGCSSYFSGPHLGSLDDASGTLSRSVKGIKIVNGAKKYGTILHVVPDLSKGGGCGEPITKNGCSPNDIGSVGAVDIFTLASSGGAGITVYSEPYGWASGSKAGYRELKNIDTPYMEQATQSLIFDYRNIDRIDSYKQSCKNFETCPGSIKTSSKYLLGLYSSGYCQTFTDNIPNLNVESIKKSGGLMNYMYIIPIE